MAWAEDAAGHTWLILDGATTRYLLVNLPGHQFAREWSLFDQRAATWPQLGRFVAGFRSRSDLEEWIEASELPAVARSPGGAEC